MAHARRKFDQARGYYPACAGHALGLFQELYATERKARDTQMDDKQTCLLRMEKAQSDLKEI